MKTKQNPPKSVLLLTALTVLPLISPGRADTIALTGIETGAFQRLTQPFVFPLATVEIVAEGDATYIGHYTMTGDFVANVQQGHAAGTFTMTADDGDMLFLDVAGHALLTDPSQVLWDETITGGTGRFEGATGDFTSEVQLEAAVGKLFPDPYIATLDGAISIVPEGGPLLAGVVVLGFAIGSSLVRRRVASPCARS